jgi:hypothetical protein
MAAAGVDVGYLATHLGMPEENIAAVATDPTAELVQAVLAAVAARAHEYDALYTQKVQLEVELETSVRGAEAQRDASSERANKAQKDVEEIRQKLQQEGENMIFAYNSPRKKISARKGKPALNMNWSRVKETCLRERTTGRQIIQLYFAVRRRISSRQDRLARNAESREASRY